MEAKAIPCPIGKVAIPYPRVQRGYQPHARDTGAILIPGGRAYSILSYSGNIGAIGGQGLYHFSVEKGQYQVPFD